MSVTKDEDDSQRNIIYNKHTNTNNDITTQDSRTDNTDFLIYLMRKA